MSKCNDWHKCYEGIISYIERQPNIKTNQHNLSVEQRLINQYSNETNLKGSFSERILLINKDFESFKKFIKSQK